MKNITFISAFLLGFVFFSNGQTNNVTLPATSNRIELPDHIKNRKAFKRAEWFSDQRRLPYDTFPIYTYAREMSREIQKALENRSNGDAYPYWHSVGPKGIHTNFVNWSVTSGRVRAVAVHPTDPLTVYIGAASGGIWKTTDGGQNWQDIGHDLPSVTFGAIAIDPNNPETVYAGSGESVLLNDFYMSHGSGLFKSTDGGQNWTVITDGFGSITHFSDLAVSPYNSNVVIASLCHGSVYSGIILPNEGLWKSTDAGATWTRYLDVPMIFDVAFHPTDPDIVYAVAGGLFAPPAGFFISSDQGETWTQSNTGLILPPLGGRIQFDVSQSDPNYIYAVIYEFNWTFGVQTTAFKSVDGGNSWAQISTGTPLGGYNGGWYDQGWYDLCIAVDPENPDHVLIGNVELHRTTNGSTFSPVRPYGGGAGGSLVHVDYHKLVFAPSDPNILYIGCDGGIYRSPDKGYTSTSLNLGLETLQFYRITGHPDMSQVIIGGMQDNGTARTTDGGDTWNFINGGDGMECFYDQSDPNVLYSAIQYGELYKSSNGGNNFLRIAILNGGWVTPIFLHPEIPTTLYAGTRSILKSTNGGGSWDTLAANVTVQQISSLAQSHVNTNFMILGTGFEHPLDSLFLVKISTDEGVTWTDVTANIPGESRWISRVVTDPDDENTMYVLRTGFSAGNKVWKTTDLGQTWTNISGDLPDLPTNDLFIDPENPDHLYLATDIGVYLSADAGQTWVFASEGIPFVPCIDFDYVKIGPRSYLRVGTYGRSIYETRLDIGVGTEESAVGGRQSAVVGNPNPFNTMTTLEYNLVETGHVTLKIFNNTGQEVITLADEQQSKGRQQVNWNAEGMPAGIYFFSLAVGGQRSAVNGKIVKY